MSAAQILIAVVGAVMVGGTFLLMRVPGLRREQYRGEPFSLTASVIAAALMAVLMLVFVWAQGRFEGG